MAGDYTVIKSFKVQGLEIQAKSVYHEFVNSVCDSCHHSGQGTRNGKPIVRWGRKVMGLLSTDRQTAEGFYFRQSFISADPSAGKEAVAVHKFKSQP